jgi:hypothetical protein
VAVTSGGVPGEAPSEDARAGVGHAGGEHRELRRHIVPEPAESVGADHQDHTGQAQQDARDAPGRQSLIGGQEVGEDGGEERRAGVQDRGEPAGDARLAPEDQAEGNDVVQRGHDREGLPRRGRAAAGDAP